MEEIRITKLELVEVFKDTLGPVESLNVVQNAILKTQLPLKADYSKDEALLICNEIKERGGFVKTLATLYSSRIIMKGRM